jgi:hypothetical protein
MIVREGFATQNAKKPTTEYLLGPEVRGISGSNPVAGFDPDILLPL